MKKNNKKKKVNIKKLFKGFTLVELLAVIVILAIIMIIAIPSVLNTMETARQKTFIEYYQKAVNAAEKKYIENSSLGTLPTPSGPETFYFYSIKEDLGFSSTGNFDGFVAVRIDKNKKTSYATMLFSDSYFLYIDRAFRDEPITDDLIEISEINSLLSKMSGGTYTNIKDVPLKSLLEIITNNFYRCAGSDVYYYSAKTGEVLGIAKYNPANWTDGHCEEMSIKEYLESIK